MAAFDWNPEFCLRAIPAAVLIASCSPIGAAEEPAQTPATQTDTSLHPESGLEIIDVSIETSKGTVSFKTELADTPEAQQRGLMFRTELADDEGMLFPSDAPETRSFWMKNTPLPLDLIFIGPDGRITNIERGEPYSLDSIPSAGLSSAVFEIRGGLSEKFGIATGDKVEWDLPE